MLIKIFLLQKMFTTTLIVQPLTTFEVLTENHNPDPLLSKESTKNLEIQDLESYSNIEKNDLKNISFLYRNNEDYSSINSGKKLISFYSNLNENKKKNKKDFKVLFFCLMFLVLIILTFSGFMLNKYFL